MGLYWDIMVDYHMGKKFGTKWKLGSSMGVLGGLNVEVEDSDLNSDCGVWVWAGGAAV